MGDLKKTSEYGKLKREALDRTVMRTSFGRVYGPLVRQATEWTICLSVRRFTASGFAAEFVCKKRSYKTFYMAVKFY